MELPRNLTIVLKPNATCNLACTYCDVAEDWEMRQTMSPELLERVISECARVVPGTVQFLWHGGEPLLVSRKLFERAHACQETYLAGRYKNWLQTNATLLNSSTLKYLKACGFRSIGTSLDGPADLHNVTRITRSGGPTFANVMKGISLAQQNGFHVGAVVVISQINVRQASRLYEFFRRERIPFSLLPIVSHGRGAAAGRALGITADEYLQFLNELLDSWLSDPDPIPVRTFHEAVKTAATDHATACVFSKNCANDFLAVDYCGDVYICNCFAGDREWCFGNIARASLETILDSPIRRSFQYATLPEECVGCDVLRICNAGCRYNALTGCGDPFARDPFCAAYRSMLTRLRHELEAVTAVGVSHAD